MMTNFLANQQPKFWQMMTNFLAKTNQQPIFWQMMTKILANQQPKFWQINNQNFGK